MTQNAQGQIHALYIGPRIIWWWQDEWWGWNVEVRAGVRGSIIFKTKCEKVFKNNMTFEQCYTTTITAKCYKCAWCRLFGDGPCPFRGIHDNWPLGYESPPPSQLFIRREMSRFICTKDELKSMNHQLGYSVYFILLSCECLYIEFSVFTRAVQAVDIRVDK